MDATSELSTAARRRGTRARPERATAPAARRARARNLRRSSSPTGRRLRRLGLSTGAIDWLATPDEALIDCGSALARCVGHCRCCQRPPPTTRPCCANRRTRPACCTCAATCGSSASRSSPWSAAAIPPRAGAPPRANSRRSSRTPASHHQRARAGHRRRLPRGRARGRRSHGRGARLRARPDLPARTPGARRIALPPLALVIRNSRRARAAAGALPPAQSHHQRACARHAGGRGGAAQRLADHGAARGGAGPRGVRHSRLDPQPARARAATSSSAQGAKLVETRRGRALPSSRFPLSPNWLQRARSAADSTAAGRPRWTRNTKSC